MAAGINPIDKRKEQKAQRARVAEAQALEDAGLPGPGTFEYVAREWWETVHKAKVSEGHADRTLPYPSCPTSATVLAIES